jgi:hypothetical protein
MIPQRHKYRPLTKTAVKDTADSLLKQHTSATTLDIKSALRQQGFWAQQHEISHLMAELADEGVYSFTFNGTYRTYFAASASNGSVSSVSNSRQRRYRCRIDGMSEVIYDSRTRSEARYTYVRENWTVYASKHYRQTSDQQAQRFLHPTTQDEISSRQLKRRMYEKCRAIVV